VKVHSSDVLAGVCARAGEADIATAQIAPRREAAFVLRSTDSMPNVLPLLVRNMLQPRFRRRRLSTRAAFTSWFRLQARRRPSLRNLQSHDRSQLPIALTDA
jgi:hypothetical protein